MKEIPLTQGFVALVDDEDYELLATVKWYYSEGYARCHADTSAFDTIRQVYPIRASTVGMHRVVMRAPPGVEVDHRQHDTLDNQKASLRLAGRDQNQRNARSNTGVSQFKGVYFHRRNAVWIAQICCHGQQYLGTYADEVSAALAYDRAAQDLFGEFALYNFPQNDQLYEKFAMPPVISRGVPGFFGVFPDRARWAARIGNKHLGSFETAYDAALYRDHYIEKHNLTLKMNF